MLITEDRVKDLIAATTKKLQKAKVGVRADAITVAKLEGKIAAYKYVLLIMSKNAAAQAVDDAAKAEAKAGTRSRARAAAAESAVPDEAEAPKRRGRKPAPKAVPAVRRKRVAARR